VIGNIYWKYLDKWFQRSFARDEYVAVDQVFTSLANADDDLFADLAALAEALKKEASDVLTLVVSGAEREARERVLSALNVLRPLRKSMSNTLRSLYSLNSDFVEISRTA
jgi:hypothetical protein